MERLKLGLALTGSFCTFESAMAMAEGLCQIYDVVPIMSENAAHTDTRFGKAADFRARLTELTGREPVLTITDAEAFGPREPLDALLVAPCTGNTLAKLANGITDTAVTMAAKAHLRNGRPLILAPSTNDGLSGSAANIGELLRRKNVYFVPFGQDDPQAKPTSLTSDLTLAAEAVAAALLGSQLQPLLICR